MQRITTDVARSVATAPKWPKDYSPPRFSPPKVFGDDLLQLQPAVAVEHHAGNANAQDEFGEIRLTENPVFIADLREIPLEMRGSQFFEEEQDIAGSPVIASLWFEFAAPLSAGQSAPGSRLLPGRSYRVAPVSGSRRIVCSRNSWRPVPRNMRTVTSGPSTETRK
jgi:hypothetical protein